MPDNNDDTDAAKTDTGVEYIASNSALVKAESTTQLEDRRISARQGLGVKPPYNPDRLAAFLELNETHAAAVRKKARYEVGFGFDVVPADGVDPDDADPLERAVIEDFWFGRDTTWQTGPAHRAEPSTPEEVQELGRQDYHAIGWEALELLVNAEGVPVGMAHVPANTVRVRKPPADDADEFENRGYVQVRNGRKRYFGVAGDRYRGREVALSGTEEDPTIRYTADDTDQEPIFVDKETGDVARGSADALPNAPANELIFVRNPSPLADDYGIPDWISSLRTITSDEAAKDYNRDFFQHDTVPRQVLKVTGGELREESKRDLRQMLDGLREDDHRTVLLEVEKFFDTTTDADVDIEFEPIGQGVSEEMSFRAFREKNEHEIAKAHEVPPILIGVTETSNRSNSQAQVHEFATDVVAPEQNKFAERIYQLVHQQAFGVTDLTIEYTLRGANQPKEEAEVARRQIQAVNGAVPVNRALQMVGLDPLPEDHPMDGDETLVADVSGGGGGGAPGGGRPGRPRAEADRPDYLPPEDNKIGERDWAAVEPDLLDKQAIETESFSSSNLDEGLFDFEEQELYISFQREEGQSSLYAYVDVPASEWSGLTAAGSAGSYHHDNIRLTYPYIEVTNFHTRLPEGPAPAPEDVPDDIPSEI